ncbi:uncharacterized protein LOC130648406 [Hydractinia symbiolongicarpus]|uniref:uncharacterized protein LOC130648406 n=1 Tax=Hydractinia symbiolongicarpus TaxID=13093 RepID=UPI00254A8E5F|nr:uncharacterized protein LOC130648406 [Hydractinia symbiolongicarpus]
MENEVRYLLHKARNHPQVACIDFIKQIFCYRFFPVCLPTSSKKITVKETCREDCEKAKSHICYTGIEDVPELSERLLEASCMTLPFENCQHVKIPTTTEVIEKSCRVDNYRKDSGTTKVSILRHSNNKATTDITFPQPIVLSKIRPQILNTTTYAKQSISLSKIFQISDLKTTLGINNLKIQQLRKFLIRSYRVNYFDDFTKDITAYLGKLTKYTPDDYLTLRNVKIFIEKINNTIYVVASGRHRLCGKIFKYSIVAESKNMVIMHATSANAISMKLIELSHRLRAFPVEIESILSQKIRLIQTLRITEPTWSILWYEGKKVAAFKGQGTIEVNAEKKNVKAELMIGVDLRFWIVRLNMKLTLQEIIRIFVEDPLSPFPFSNDINIEDVMPHDIDFTFSTSDVKLPKSTYLEKQYSLYKDANKINSRLSIRATGETKKSKASFSHLYGDRKFKLDIDTQEDGKTTFLLRFDDNMCKQDRHWEMFEKTLRILQSKTNSSENAQIKIKSYCDHCCESRYANLVSIKGAIYWEASTFDVFSPKINYYLDLDINVAKREYLHIYRLKKYFIKAA